MDLEHREAPLPSIPFISERVRDQLAQETQRNPSSGLRVAEELTEGVLIDVAQVNYPLVEAVATTLREMGQDQTSYYRVNGFTKGVAVVLRAFHLETGSGLIGNLGSLNEDDIVETQALIRHGESLSEHSTPIIERVLAQPRIPEQQVNLRQAVDDVASRVGHLETRHVRTGAAVMFKVLSKHWGKLAKR